MQRHTRSLSSTARRICLLSWCLAVSACVRRLPVQTAPPIHGVKDLDYIDLRAGWRVRVVVPILRTNGYIVPMTTQMRGNTITVRAGRDFIGYETDYYSVSARDTPKARIVFGGAKAVVQGKTSKRTGPALQLFSFALNLKFVRLVYFVRESESDHDMVLLAAANESTLDKVTAGVTTGDSGACKSSAEVMCVRVPAGVAVVPEEKVRIDGRIQWKPVR